jgi:hypothetical protein
MPLLDWLHRPTRPAARRRPHLVVESLEDRALPSGIPSQYVLDDPGHQFAAFPLLLPDLEATGQILSGLLGGRGSLEVVVRPNNDIPRSDGSTLGIAYLRPDGAGGVYENAALAEAQTGVNPNGTGPEIELDFNTQDFLAHAWFDPSGAARTARVPAGRTDFISVALHETLHALAFQGYRATSGSGYGTIPPGPESSFDALSSFGTEAQAGTLYFRGSLASAVYGGPVPLTSVGPSDPLADQNFYHLGNPAGRPGADLVGDVMNGMVFEYGKRYTVSRLDLAVLADLGWAARGFPAPPAVTLPAGPPPPAAVQVAAAPAPPNLPPPHRHHHHRHPHHGRQPAGRFAAAHRLPTGRQRLAAAVTAPVVQAAPPARPPGPESGPLPPAPGNSRS